MADYFADPTELGQGELSQLVQLARALDAANLDVERAEAKLKEAQDHRDFLARKRIPEAMRAVGLSELPLADGNRVLVKDFVRVSLTEENKDKGHQWLREIGSGALIKRKVEVQFSRGQDNEAGAFVAECRERGYEPTDTETVPWNSLDAFGRARLDKGEKLPPFFSIVEFPEAVIVPPAKTRASGSKRRQTKTE